MLAGFDLVEAARASSVVMYSDYQVIVGHVNDDYKSKGVQMKRYLSMVKERVNKNFLVKFMQVLKEENEQADRLVKAASAEHMTISSRVLSFIQYSPAIVDVNIQVIPTRVDCMAPIISFFKNGTLLENHNAS